MPPFRLNWHEDVPLRVHVAEIAGAERVAVEGLDLSIGAQTGPISAFDRGPGFVARVRRAGMAEGVARRRSGTA